MKRVFILCLLVAIISCSKDEPAQPSTETLTIEQYITDNTLTATQTAEGVYQYAIISNPAGNSNGDVFSLYYTLSDLETGSVIESHLAADGDPVKLLHNSAAVFPLGLDYGLAGIREGETYGIIVPSSHGYGIYSTSSIPKSTILHFEVEIVTRETEADIASIEDASINAYITANNLDNAMITPVDAIVAIGNGTYYKRTGIGTGGSPMAGDSVTVDYQGRLLDESSFDDLANFKYAFGLTGANKAVINGFDEGIAQMEIGESATVIIPSAQAYGASVRVIPVTAFDELIDQFVIPTYSKKVGPYEVLIFDVTLQAIHSQ